MMLSFYYTSDDSDVYIICMTELISSDHAMCHIVLWYARIVPHSAL